MQNIRDWTVGLHPLVLLGGGTVLVAFVNVLNAYAFVTLRSPLAENYGIQLPFWVWFTGPALAVAGMYATVGASIVRAGYDNVFSRVGMFLQTIIGPFIVFAVWALAHSCITYTYQMLVIGEMQPSYGQVLFLFPMYPASFVGVWGGLVCYWLWNTVRSDRRISG